MRGYMILSPNVSRNWFVVDVPLGTMLLVDEVNPSIKPFTVMIPSGECEAPTPKVELPGVAKSTWKRRTKTCVSTVPATAELFTSMNHSGWPGGGGSPVRRPAGTQRY